MLTSRTSFGKYEIVGQLGAGGMGSVHLAHDSSLDREVAIKVLRGPVVDEELRARFLREARATANLHHVNIITIYEVGQHEQQPFIAMEYVAGDSLATVIAQQRPVPLATRLNYLEQLCAGLDFAHRAGIVHRDVKPANVMVDARQVIRILDFGIARLEGSGMTMDGAMMGTINYMSPEQMLGRRVDHRSDIFAVGAVAYELITYCQAFPGTLDDLLRRLPNEPPPTLQSLWPAIDAELEAIVMRALEKDPDRRFPDLSQMQAALAAVRQRIESERGPAFVVPTPAAAAAHAATRVRPVDPRLAEDVRAQLHAASKCLDTGDPARAADLAQRVIERLPSSVEAHALLVRAHRALAKGRVQHGISTEGDSPVPDRRRRGTIAIVATAAGLIVGVMMMVATMMRVLDGDDAATTVRKTTPASVARSEVPPARAGADTTPPPVVAPAEEAALKTAAFESVRRVERARLAAIRAHARELAQELFVAGSASAELARRAQERGDYTEVASMAATATRQFTDAVAEAGREAERRRVAAADTSAARALPPIDPAPSSETASPLAEGGSTNNGELAAVTTAPPPPPPPPGESGTSAAEVSPIVRERAAILAALDQYRAAYQGRNITALKAVYPTLTGEALQARERAFKDKRTCRALDVSFADPVISLTADETVAHVNVMSTYVCTPVTGQAKPQEPLPDVFQMRKNGDGWVITVMGAMGRS